MVSRFWKIWLSHRLSVNKFSVKNMVPLSELKQLTMKVKVYALF